ncbi:MAG: hypothetical protein HQ500_11850 [Flavobacteriales bacterium]|nr:hypothetical protein [Flavobacteriales bacterium]
MSILSLKIAYLTLTWAMILLLVFIGNKAINASYADKAIAARKRTLLIAGLVLWQAYTFLITISGVLNNFDFPPRFFLLLILPLFVFTGIFAYQHRNGVWLSSIPLHWLVFFQSFRILVESIFVASVAQGILNPEVTIEGYNFDMIFAFTAPIIGFLTYRKWISRKLVLLWNYLGLAVIASIIFLFLSSLFNPQLFGSEVALLPAEAVAYPYVLVAGFLMPVAVFVHVLSIVQLSRRS